MPNTFNRGLLDPNIYGAPAPFGFGAPFGATPSPSAGAGGAPQPGYDPSGNYDQGMPPLQNVDDDTTTWRPGGFTPVPLDVTRPVREGTLKALGQIFKYFRDRDYYGNRGGGGGNGGGNSAEEPDVDCDKEWADSMETCRRILRDRKLREPEMSSDVRGGYNNPYDCARGMVPPVCLDDFDRDLPMYKGGRRR